MLMPLQRTRPWIDERLCPLVAGLIIVLVAVLRLVYLGWLSPLDLSSDEAHYWDWARHLDWSYYSKGPLVAWVIHLSCALLGSWSEAQTGSLMFAVRFPAVIFGSLLLVSLYVLTMQLFDRPRLALGVVLVALTLPMVTAGSMLMTIDSPYTCFWGWALVLAHRAVFRGSFWAWPALGLVVGLGCLAKYTMIVFLPSLGLFLLSRPDLRKQLVSPGFWLMVSVAGLACLPILIWNSQNGWVTFLHVQRLAGLAPKPVDAPPSAGIKWLGPILFVGGQFALLLGFWFVVWARAMISWNPWRHKDAGVAFLWWLSLPMFTLFLVFSLKTGGGGLNWPVTTYLSGLVLAMGWLTEQYEVGSPGEKRAWTWSAGLACGLGLALTLFVHSTGTLYPLLASVLGPASEKHPYPLRRADPTCRLRGWQTLAARVDEVREQLRRDGHEPIIVGDSWNLPGVLGLYCREHPQVYSIGRAQFDRHSQYDFWPGPVDSPDAFRGKTFIIVGHLAPTSRLAFDRVRDLGEVTHEVDGHPIAGWGLAIGYGFKGFPIVPRAAH